MNEVIEVLAANELAQELWEVDLARDYSSPVDRNMLTVATTPRFVDRVTNWDEMVSVGIGIMKGHHRGPERLPEGTSQYFAAVMQRLFEGDARYVSRFLNLWEKVPPRTPKVWWWYPVDWEEPALGQLRFVVTVSLASERDGLYFNDWLPRDAATAVTLEKLGQVGRPGLS